MQRCRVKAAMLQTLPALFIWSPLLGPYVNLPGECMCCLVYNQLISTEYVLHLPGDKALRRGWETREGRKIPRRTAGRELGLVHDRVVEVGERERKKIHFNSFSLKDEGRKKKKKHSALLTFPRLQENRVGHDIFNLHCQNVSPEQSRYISLSGKRRFF